jgi:hypothetical protein
MKMISTLVGLTMLGGVALSSETASAMPAMNPAPVSQNPLIQQTALVCNQWGHCWHRPSYGYYYHPHYYGYYHPHYYGGWGWHHHYYGGGWGWQHHYYGGWGWHHWHHWHQW